VDCEPFLNSVGGVPQKNPTDANPWRLKKIPPMQSVVLSNTTYKDKR